MTSAILAALLLPFQVAPRPDAPLEPPVGTSGAYLSLAQAVRVSSRTDMAKAGRLASLLPRRDPAVYWDDRNVPAVSREAFRTARDYAFAEWARILPEFKPRIVATPALAAKGLVFSFEPRLAHGAGATHFSWMDAKGARLETVLGLRRGEFYTGEVDVHNEVLFAMGTYLGLLPNAGFGGAMGRTDGHASVATTPRSTEARIAEEALVHSTGLRQAVAKGRRLDVFAPRFWVESKSVDLGTRVQGQSAETSFAVSNNGDGPMLLSVEGDCGCLSAIGPKRLEAGESGVVRARYDTSALGGGISHKVLIRTTDSETPDIAVTMNIAVRTLARFIVPGGTTLAAKDGQSIDFYLVVDESNPLTLNTSRVDGVEGELTVEPWSGTLADPALKEGPLPRTGYRLRFIPKGLPAGLSLAAFTVVPASGERLVGNVFLQRGIVATPQMAAFTDLGTTPSRVEIALTNPGHPFRILSVRAEGQGIGTVLRPSVRSDHHTVAVTLDPSKLVVNQTRRVVVRTDDPSQPEILIPIIVPES